MQPYIAGSQWVVAAAAFVCWLCELEASVAETNILRQYNIALVILRKDEYIAYPYAHHPIGHSRWPDIDTARLYKAAFYLAVQWANVGVLLLFYILHVIITFLHLRVEGDLDGGEVETMARWM